jgi:hypothetical protein
VSRHWPHSSAGRSDFNRSSGQQRRRWCSRVTGCRAAATAVPNGIYPEPRLCYHPERSEPKPCVREGKGSQSLETRRKTEILLPPRRDQNDNVGARIGFRISSDGLSIFIWRAVPARAHLVTAPIVARAFAATKLAPWNGVKLRPGGRLAPCRAASPNSNGRDARATVSGLVVGGIKMRPTFGGRGRAFVASVTIRRPRSRRGGMALQREHPPKMRRATRFRVALLDLRSTAPRLFI